MFYYRCQSFKIIRIIVKTNGCPQGAEGMKPAAFHRSRRMENLANGKINASSLYLFPSVVRLDSVYSKHRKSKLFSRLTFIADSYLWNCSQCLTTLISQMENEFLNVIRSYSIGKIHGCSESNQGKMIDLQGFKTPGAWSKPLLLCILSSAYLPKWRHQLLREILVNN